MRIELNGESLTTQAATLALLLEEQGFDPNSVATAIDGDFVPRSLRAAASLQDGIKVEVLSPMQGG